MMQLILILWDNKYNQSYNTILQDNLSDTFNTTNFMISCKEDNK